MLGRIDSDVVLPWLDGKHDEIRKVAVELFDNDFRSSKQFFCSIEKKIKPIS